VNYIRRLYRRLLRPPHWYQFWKKAGYRRRRLKFHFFLLIFSLIGLASALTALRLGLHLTFQAKTPPTRSLLVEFVYHQDTDTILIHRSQIISTPKRSKSPSHPHQLKLTPPHMPEKSIPFTWHTDVHVEDFDQLMGLAPDTTLPAAYTLPNPVAIIKIDYVYGSSITLPHPVSNQPYPVDTADLNRQLLLAESEPIELQHTPTDGFVDFVFIANNYSDFGRFRADASAMRDFLLTIYPFNIFTQQLRFHYIDNQQYLGCFRPSSIPRLIICDRYLVELAAASVPVDQLIVIDNSNEYGGSGSSGLAITYRDIDHLAKEVLVHELGHSFGGLGDEYYLGPTYFGTPPWPNCTLDNKCKAWIRDWKKVRAEGCHEVCGYGNLYRPTFNDSLMRTLFPDNGFKFGPVSQEHLYRLLAAYAGIIPADLDQDGDIDYLDHQILTQHYTFTCNYPGDLTGDCLIDLFDANRLIKHLGHKP
jgi:hypothetical protein